MNDRILLRGAGFCACLAALLHIPGLDSAVGDQGKPVLYLIIDVLLTLALVGLFAHTPHFRTNLGTLGFAGAITALLIIRTGARLIPGADVYSIGATIFTVSLAIASLSLVRTQGFIRYAALAWIGSLIVGLAGMAAPVLMTGAIALFSIGFMFAGVGLIRS